MRSPPPPIPLALLFGFVACLAAVSPASADQAATNEGTVTLHGGLSITAPADAGNLSPRSNHVSAATVSGQRGQVQGAEVVQPFPVAEYPLPHQVGVPTAIQLEVPLEASHWRFVRAVKHMDGQLPGITVRTYGTCAENPAVYCVQVKVGSYNRTEQIQVAGYDVEWIGVCTFPDMAHLRVVYLNTFYGRHESGRLRQQVSAHEFGHVLGLSHHEGPGVTGTGAVVLSPTEVAVLQEAYQ